MFEIKIRKSGNVQAEDLAEVLELVADFLEDEFIERDKKIRQLFNRVKNLEEQLGKLQSHNHSNKKRLI